MATGRNLILIGLGLAAAALIYGQTSGKIDVVKIVDKLALGLRSNNPGNIRASATMWQGQVGVNAKGFIIFDTPLSGIRALFKVIDTYWNKYSLRTVAGIVSRWAPPSENNTPAYIAAVAGEVGISPTAQLSVTQLPALVKAIIRHENGAQPYSDDQVAQAQAMV